MKQVLTKKVNSWIGTITDEEVKKAINNDLVITGGCFVSMLNNESPNDFDCYFKTKDTVLKVARYYANLWNEIKGKQANQLTHKSKIFVLDGAKPDQEILDYYQVKDIKDSMAVMLSNTSPERVKIIFPSDGVIGNPDEVKADEELGTPKGFVSSLDAITEIDGVEADKIIEQEKKEYFPVFFSTNAITLSNGIQVIVRFYGEPLEIHDTFDFTHTKAYWTRKDNKIVIPNEVYEAVINKTLSYTGSKYPVCSLFRLRKFLSRGWTINAGQILKIAMQISELNLCDIGTLEDQLVGVDSLYFSNLIQQFHRMEKEKDDFKLTSSYVMSIVDKIF
jgi:hypothetical protein